MPDLMEQTKLTVNVPDTVRRALAIYAAESDQTVGQVLTELVAGSLPDYMKRAEELIRHGAPHPLKKGRPPKKKPPG